MSGTADDARTHAQDVQALDAHNPPIQTELDVTTAVNDLPARGFIRPGCSRDDFWSISDEDRNKFLEEELTSATRNKLKRHVRAHRLMTTDDGRDAIAPCSICRSRGVRCRVPVKGYRNGNACAFCRFRSQSCDVRTIITQRNEEPQEERDHVQEMREYDKGEASTSNNLPALEHSVTDMFGHENAVTFTAEPSDPGAPIVTGATGDITNLEPTETEVNDMNSFNEQYEATIATKDGLTNDPDSGLLACVSVVRALVEKLDKNEKIGVETCEVLGAIQNQVARIDMDQSGLRSRYDASFRSFEATNQELQDRIEKQEEAFVRKISILKEHNNQQLEEQKQDTSRSFSGLKAEFGSRFEGLEHESMEQMDELRARQDNGSRESSLHLQELSRLLEDKEGTIARTHASLDMEFDSRFQMLEHACCERIEQLEERQEHVFFQMKGNMDAQQKGFAGSIAALRAEYEGIFEKIAISTRRMKEAVEQHEKSAAELRNAVSTSISASSSSKRASAEPSSRIEKLEDDNRRLTKENRKLNKKIARQKKRSVRQKDFDRLGKEVAELKAAFAAAADR